VSPRTTEGHHPPLARRIATATAFTDCALMRIEKSAMLHVLHAEPAFAALFTAYLLSRNRRLEADLIDQLFNLDGLWARPGRCDSRRRDRQTSPQRRGVALYEDRWVLHAGR
jgi:CRP-like cAMP-binding protein